MKTMDSFVQECLVKTVSQDPVAMKEAEIALKSMEANPLYLSSLLSVYENNAPKNVRLMAAICMKNSVEKYWRKGVKCELPIDQKHNFKHCLLSIIGKEVEMDLLLQMSLLLARISRFEFPGEWPTVLSDIVTKMNVVGAAGQQDPNFYARYLVALHHVVKTLCSKTLPVSRAHLVRVAPDIFSQLFPLFQVCLENYFMDGQNLGHGNAAFYALKSLYRLMIYGGAENILSDSMQRLPIILVEKVAPFLAPLILQDETISLKSLVSRFQRTIGKFFVSFLEYHPIGFVKSLACRNAIFFFYRTYLSQPTKVTVNSSLTSLTLSSNSNSSSNHHHPSQKWETMEKLCIQGLTLLRGIIRNPVLTKDSSEWRSNFAFEAGIQQRQPNQSNQNVEMGSFSDLNECKLILEQQVLTSSFLEELSSLILEKYLVMNEAEFIKVIEDPESFFLESCDDSWKYNLSKCAEMIFQDLMICHQEMLGPLLSGLLERAVNTPLSLGGVDCLTIKYSIYGAISKCAADLRDHLDMDIILVKHLIPEFETVFNSEEHRKVPAFSIIRIRFAQILESWVDVQMNDSIRPQVFHCLVQMISPLEPFLAVRLYACAALGSMIENWDFTCESFLTFLEPALNHLMGLITCVEESESKLSILSNVCAVVNRMSDHMLPYVTTLIVPKLPSIWESSVTSSPLKGSLLLLLQSIVEVLKESSVILHSFIMPVLLHCTDCQVEESLYLMEDALNLWMSLMSNSPSLSRELACLFPRILALMETTSEELRLILPILEAYITLNEPSIYNEGGNLNCLIYRMTKMITDVKEQAVSMLIKCLEAFVCLNPSLTVQCLPLFQVIYQSVLEDFSSSGMVLISFLARIAATHENVFNSLISSNGVEAFDALLRLWLDNYENMMNPKWKKAVSMAFGTLIGSPNYISAQLYQHLGVIVGVVWIESLTNTNVSKLALRAKAQSPSSSSSSLPTATASATVELTTTSNTLLLLERDPIVMQDLHSFLSIRIKSQWQSNPEFRLAFNNGNNANLIEKLNLLLP